MAQWEVAALGDIEEYDDGRCAYRPVRHHFGITTYGVTAWTGAAAGDRIINEHDEEGEMDELYLVHRGTARFELDGESVEAPAGSFVHCRPGVMRTAFAVEPGTTIIAIGGGQEGEPYRPGGWELWSPMRPLMEAKDYAGVLAKATPLLESGVVYPELIYNVACAESLMGQTDQALAHLRQAFELAPPLRDWAPQDDDLAALHGQPAFTALISG